MFTVAIYEKHTGTVVISPEKRCGCVCVKCGWRSYRAVKFLIPLAQRFDVATATAAIKGQIARFNCPKCGGTVKYTHVASPNRRSQYR